jgi:hypothetical protein
LSAQVQIRQAVPDDVQQIYDWIVELATCERAPEQVTGTAELLGEAPFGTRPSAEALLRRVAEITIERRGTRLEWVVLDGNAPAIALYERVAAKLLRDWRVCRLDGAGLARVAEAVQRAR